MRIEFEPAESDFLVGPGLDDVGSGPENQVEVVGHDGVGEDIDSEDRGEDFESPSDPFPSRFVVFPGNGIFSREISSSDASLDGMDNADLIGGKLFGSGSSGHGFSSRGGMGTI